MTDTRRLFFALWPDDNLRSEITARTAATIGRFPGRSMAPGNLHITLAFVGSVPVERLASLMELGQRVQFNPCTLVFDRLVVWRQARVLALAATSLPEQLLLFVGQLQAQLTRQGLRVDDRPYRPHITLGRDVRGGDSSEATTPLIWTARDFVLVESVSTPGGVQYQVLERFAS